MTSSTDNRRRIALLCILGLIVVAVISAVIYYFVYLNPSPSEDQYITKPSQETPRIETGKLISESDKVTRAEKTLVIDQGFITNDTYSNKKYDIPKNSLNESLQGLNETEKADAVAQYINKYVDLRGKSSITLNNGDLINITVYSQTYDPETKTNKFNLTVTRNGNAVEVHNPVRVYDAPFTIQEPKKVLVNTTVSLDQLAPDVYFPHNGTKLYNQSTMDNLSIVSSRYENVTVEVESPANALLVNLANAFSYAPYGDPTFDGPDPTVIFYGSGTWTAPANVHNASAILVGGGGGAGGGYGTSISMYTQTGLYACTLTNTNIGPSGQGAGGFASEYNPQTNISVTPGTGYSIVVGTAGSGTGGGVLTSLMGNNYPYDICTEDNQTIQLKGSNGVSTTAFGYSAAGGNGGNVTGVWKQGWTSWQIIRDHAATGSNGNIVSGMSSTSASSGTAGYAGAGAAGGSNYGAGGGGGGPELYGHLVTDSGGAGSKGFVYLTYTTIFSPVASFTVNKTSGVMPLAVAFTDTTTNTPTGWIWNFTNVTGNNTPVTFSNSKNPTQIFGYGNYKITLTASNIAGTSTSTQPTWINVTLPIPQADFTANQTTGLYPLDVQFTDTTSNAPTTWVWSFGDGQSSALQNPIHSYASGGSYTVTLTASNLGGSNQTTKLNYITVYNKTVSGFSANKTSGVFSLAVKFSPSKFNDNATWWNWSFGDGTYLNGSTQSPTHVYATGGTFTVTQNAGNAYWTNTTTIPDYITVYNSTFTGFTANQTTGVFPLAVQFTLTSSNDNASYWNWSFGDGVWFNTSDSGEKNPVHTYANGGSYTVSEWATNQYASNVTTKPNYITVYNQTLSGFNGVPTTGYTPLVVSFSVTNPKDNATSWSWGYGDGGWFNSTTQNATHVYTTAGTYSVTEIANNPYYSNTTVLTDYITAIEPPAPVANFSGSPLSGLFPLTVSFVDESNTINPQTWTWAFGDGGTNQTQNPAHTFYSGGTYTVSQTVTNLGGSNTSTKVDYITIYNQTTSGFTGTPRYGMIPLTVDFNTTVVNDNGTIWNWSFNGGLNWTNGSTQNISYIFASGGNYTIMRVVQNDHGGYNLSIMPKYIEVRNTTVTGFTANVTEGIFPLTVVFNVTTPDDNATYWNWSFGDGNWVNSTTQNITHTYWTGGSYTVSEKASNAYTSNTTTITDYITVYNKTTSSFTSNATTGITPVSIAFSGYGQNATSYYWEFGDGNTSTDQNPTHTYEIIGTYTVRYSTSNGHWTNWTNITNYISATPYAAPVAKFTSNITSGVYPLSVEFTDQSTGLGIYNWYWLFGDGNLVSEQNPVHTFYSGGNYTVTMTAINAGGSNTSTKTNYITVYNQTYSDFTANQTTGYVPFPVTFTVTKTNDNATWWNWSFGDGNWSNGTNQTVSHVYEVPGTYDVTEIANSIYASSTTTKTGYIITSQVPIPEPSFIANITVGIVPMAVQFNDTTIGLKLTAWNWSFGNGEFSEEQNPVVTYYVVGNYTVTLNVTNAGGTGSSARVDYINVYPIQVPIASFISNVTIGFEPMAVLFNDTSQNIPTAWQWNFTNVTGNNTPVTFSSSRNVTQIFGTGNWSIVLGVNNIAGTNFTQETYFINVSPPPEANFTMSEVINLTPNIWNFNDTSEWMDITEYRWDFGDGNWSNGSTNRNVTYKYPTFGNYTITHYIVNASGTNHVSKTQSIYLQSNFTVVNFTTPGTYTWTAPEGAIFIDYLVIAGGGSGGGSGGGGGGAGGLLSGYYYSIIPGVTYNIMVGSGGLGITGSATMGVNGSNSSINNGTAEILTIGGGGGGAYNALKYGYEGGSGGGGSQGSGGHGTTGQGYDGGVGSVLQYVGSGGGGGAGGLGANGNGTVAGNGGIGLPININGNYTYYAGGGGGGITGGAAQSYGGLGGGGRGGYSDTPATNATQYGAGGGGGGWATGRSGYGYSGAVIFRYISVPYANFTANATTGSIPFAVQFTDTSTGDPLYWNWSFGDGNYSTDQNPMYIYNLTGTFTVSLTVSNEHNTNAMTKVGYITTTVQKPITSFTSNTTFGEAPLSVLFTDTSGNVPIAWNWSFGDGYYSNQQNPTHKYLTQGNYTVSLNASNSGGFNKTTTTNYIWVNPTSPPVANFTATPTTGDAPLTVKFTDTSMQWGSYPTAWNWSFGDGNYSNDEDIIYTYPDGGSYTVNLTVSNAGGTNTLSRPNYIYVSKPPAPVTSFTANITSGDTPLAVQFTDTSGNTPIIWFWNFGDGYNSTEQNPIHIYTTGGNFSVALTATNAGGSNFTVYDDYINVTSIPIPVPSFTSNVTSGTPPFSVQFTDTSGNSPTIWNWSFGDGNYSTEQNPKHWYNGTGIYTISLTASNEYGNATVTMNNYIISSMVSGYNDLDITLDPLYKVMFMYTDLSGNLIPTVGVTDSLGNSTTTSNGTFIGYYPFGTVEFTSSASGFAERTDTYSIDMNINDTLELSPALSGQTLVVSTKTVRFVCQNYNGEPIVGMNASAIAVTSTVPLSWVPALFGIDLGTTPVLNSTMNGTTGVDGGVTFIMLSTGQYAVHYQYIPLGINETRYYYPQESEYIETFWTQTPTYASTGITTDFYTYRDETNGTIVLGALYNDTYSSTDNLTFTIMDRNKTIIYQTQVTPS
jgi:PKD repeat protein